LDGELTGSGLVLQLRRGAVAAYQCHHPGGNRYHCRGGRGGGHHPPPGGARLGWRPTGWWGGGGFEYLGGGSWCHGGELVNEFGSGWSGGGVFGECGDDQLA
jgi:hypothetical protein